ncbi:MAG TPA: YceH family protein [Acidobacteriaceae bacterium]|jgi:hypothetical protein|nr:YceH family protein [Acidobacteriaceae bacterium]
MQLTPTEARVLGALVEKEITTPEYYPLSLNALINACNQKNNREPVMALDEVEVRQALHGLEDDRLAGAVRGDGRVPKYEHHMQEVFNFTRGEIAVICVLLLRGPQTPGELRGRTERMYRFDELSDVQTVLQKLMTREPVLVKVLPRQPGTKEARYAHLLSGDVESFEPVGAPSYPVSSYSASPSVSSQDSEELNERMAQLEAEVAILTRELGELCEQVERISKLIE